MGCFARVLTLIGIIGVSSAAYAQQGYTIFTPGQPRTFVEPNGLGGATVFTPGQPRTFVDPTPNGGYTVFTPGQPRTFVQPNPGYSYSGGPRNPFSGCLGTC
jgi:hypothetical protein